MALPGPSSHWLIQTAMMAHSERAARFDLGKVATTATKTTAGWRLNGHKIAGRVPLSERDTLQVGGSRITWKDGGLTIDVDEISSLPLISRVRGQIRLTPTAVTEVEATLTPAVARTLKKSFAQ